MRTFLAACLFLLPGTAAMADCAALGNDVTPLVCKLTTGFDPNASPYQEPPLVSPGCTDPGNLAAAIQSAFLLAHPRLKEEICLATAIFIVPDYSWGFWENPFSGKGPKNGGPPRTFLAIQAGLLNQTLDAIENGYQVTLLKMHTPNPPISFSSNVLDTDPGKVSLGVLGVLAHEIGHIKWHRDNVYAAMSCYYPAFISASWDSTATVAGKNTLAEFIARKWAPPPPDALVPGNPPTQHVDHGGGRKVPNPYDSSSLSVADIRKIYDAKGSGFTDGFVTAFAATSPEEDFVETYRIVALKTNLGFPSLQLNLDFGNGSGGGASISVLTRTNSVVTAKMACVSNSLFGVALSGLGGVTSSGYSKKSQHRRRY